MYDENEDCGDCFFPLDECSLEDYAEMENYEEDGIYEKDKDLNGLPEVKWTAYEQIHEVNEDGVVEEPIYTKSN